MKKTKGYTLSEVIKIINKIEEKKIEEKLNKMYEEDLQERINKARKNNNLKGLTSEEISILEDDGEIFEGYDPMTQGHYWDWSSNYSKKIEKEEDDQPLPF
jgi:hypothetical protein